MVVEDNSGRSRGGFIAGVKFADNILRTIAWGSAREQGALSLSSTEAELKSASRGVECGRFIQNLLSELPFFNVKTAINLECDSRGVITSLQRNPASTRLRAAGVRFLYLRKLILDDLVKITKRKGTEIVADLLTKPMKTNSDFISKFREWGFIMEKRNMRSDNKN